MKLIESEKHDVPDNNYAKAMYYLYCVFAVVGEKARAFIDVIRGITDYKNYYRLSNKDKENLIALGITFNPEFMKKQSLFRLLENSSPEDKSIQIVEMTALNFKPENPKIVYRFMLCSEYWIEYYYYGPMTELGNKK